MSEKKCPSCGAGIDFNATECKYCGEAIAVNSSQRQQATSETIKTNTQTSNEDLKFLFLKPYYRGKFLSIETSGLTYKGGWNWCAFLFSWIWGLTKGLWGASLATLAINLILACIGLRWISLILSILWGIRGNYLYYNLHTNKTQFPSTF